MKKLLLALLIAVTVMFGITACATDDSTGDNTQNPPDTGSIEDTFREGSTVWYYASDVHIIPALGITRDDLETVRDKIDTLANNVYISSVYAEEQKCELIVGYVDDREASVKAYRLLERMEKESYFDARYIIYAEDGKVAIAYDENEYSSLQALNYALDYFVESFIEGKEYVAFGAGNRFENTVDLIEEQELIDGALMAEAWDKLFIEAGGETNPERAQAIVDVIRKMHAMYDENVVGWYANLYDPVNGGFYVSNSGRNNEGFLPDIESTVQALSWLQSTGMLRFADDNYANALPEWMKNQIIAFAKSLQNPKNGYFYHPQWTQEMVDNKISRRGRDLSWATSVLTQLGSAPTYNAPDGTRGDGIDEYEFWVSVDWYGYIGDKSEFEIGDSASVTVSLGGSTSDAVAAVIATSDVILTADDNTSYLANHENFYNYMWSLPLYNTAGISYTIGNDFNATRKQILAKSKSLGEYLDDPSKPYYGMTLCDIWIDYFNQKVNPENGLWEKETSFAGTNGLMKLYSSYTLFGECLPYPMQSAQSVIYNLTSDEDPSHVCHNYNLWVSIVGIKDNVRKYGDPETRDAVLAYIDEALKDSAVEMIEMTIKRVSKFQKPDGSFSYNANVNGGSSQGMPVSLSVNEGGINATSICMTGNFNQMLAAFGFSQIDIFGEADWMRFCEVIDGLGPITKFTPEPVIVDFEDGEYSSFQAMRGATLDVVDYNGSRQLMMSFAHLTSGWPGMDITKTLASNSGDYMVIEGDFTFMNAQDGYYEFYINASSAKPMYFQFHIAGNTVKIVQSRVSSGPSFTIGARGQEIHLRLEYFLNSKGESALRINVGGQYIGTITNDNKNTSALGGALPTNINRIEFAGSYKNGGCVYVDNFNFGPDFYQDLDGDEMPDAFPDNEAVEGGGVVIPTPGATSPIDFESISGIDPTIIKISHDNQQIVEFGGSKALEVTFGADTSDEIIIYKTKAAESEANTLVFKADITPTITGQYNINLRNSSSTRLAQFTINNQGDETGICGAYDNDGVWQPKFCEVQKTIKLRVEYGPVEQDGKTYMQLRAYVNGELKFESKLIDKYLASEENSIRSINQIRIAENNKAQGTGKLYLDNVEFAEVLKLPETLPEDTVDEQGFVKFEEMESIDALIAKAKLADTLVVTEKNGKGAMAFKYTKGVTEEFTLYPTKNETEADLMVLEANVTDSYANPRVLKIYAGSRLVYDFRINGSGGFGAESNKSWWGSGKYQKDVTFNLAITVKVTDGKVDLNLYINGEKIARPTGSTGYGVNLDLTCEADLVEKISHITITDNEQPTGPDAGTVYLTDYRFVKVVDDGSFVPSAPGEGGDPETPVTPPYENDLSSYYVSFDGMTAVNTSIMKPGSTGTVITVGKLDGSDAAKLEFGLERWDEAFMYPTYKNASANSVIVEMDVMFDAEHAKDAYVTFYLRGASSEKLYILNVRTTAEGFSFDDNQGLSKKNVIAREKFKLRIEFNEVTVSGEKKYQILLFVNGELLNASDPIGKTSKNNIPDIGRFDILSSPTFGGAAYIDNFAFIRAFRDVKFEGEISHEHNFVEGKCECGETDPSYKPECEHSYAEGVCTKCGEADPDYVAPECEHSYADGKCTKCGEADPDYVPEDDGERAPLTPDENGYLSFENMTAEGSSLIASTVAGGLSVKANGGSDALEFIYTEGATEKFKLLPTLTEDGATIMILEADITDSYSKPRVLKIMAGERLVYDFRINGSGGFAAESNNVWWGGNHYKADTKYNLKITVEAKDGKVDVCLYVNGSLVNKPSAYGTKMDITAEENLVELITHVDIIDGATAAGSVYIDNYRFVKIAEDDTPGEGGGDPVTPPEGGDTHEHTFVEGKCECGETDPSYKPECEHSYSEGVCTKCGEADPDYVAPELPDEPAEPEIPTSDYGTPLTFEGIDTFNTSIIKGGTADHAALVVHNGSKVFAYTCTADTNDEFFVYRTESDVSDGDTFVFEADITADLTNGEKAGIYNVSFRGPSSSKLYTLTINDLGGAYDTTNNSTKDFTPVRESYKLRIEYGYVEIENTQYIQVRVYVNGELKLTSKTIEATDVNRPQDVARVQVLESGKAVSGTIYIDNIVSRVVKLAADEPEHTHEFVEGKCECGETDPDYKPECEHSYSEGVCTKCGEADPDYVAPELPDEPAEPEIPTSDYGTPLTFEGIEAANPSVIKSYKDTASALAEHNGSTAFAATFSDATNDEFYVYRTEADGENANTYVFEATITPTISGQFTFKLRGPSSSTLYSFTVNGSGGAYDNEGVWQANFAPANTTLKIRMEYSAVESGGVTYMQTRVYINGELKVTSKLVDKYVATDANEIGDVLYVQIAENNKANAGTFYIDNIVSRCVRISAE